MVWESNDSFTTFGVKHMGTWNATQMKKPRTTCNVVYTSGAAHSGKTLLGDSSGNFYVGSSINKKGLHSKPIDCITVGTKAIVTGGKDRMVNILSPQGYALIAKFDVLNVFP